MSGDDPTTNMPRYEDERIQRLVEGCIQREPESDMALAFGDLELPPMGELNGHIGRHAWNGEELVWWCAGACPHPSHRRRGPVLVATNVGYCVTHSATGHDDGRAWETCRFRQLFYFLNPTDEDDFVWSDAPCGACEGRGCDVCGEVHGGETDA